MRIAPPAVNHRSVAASVRKFPNESDQIKILNLNFFVINQLTIKIIHSLCWISLIFQS